MSSFNFFSGFFSVFGIIFIIIFVLFLVIFIVALVRALGQWNKNNRSPKLTVPATVVSRRTNTTYHHHHGNDMNMGSTHHTSYYATFQVESGDRMELPVPGNQYGLLIEGDTGLLTFQGTRFFDFERTGRTNVY